MPDFSHSVSELVRSRFSCRKYSKEEIGRQKIEQLRIFTSSLGSGPFGTGAQFRLITAEESDRNELKGLGTYGFVQNPPAFIVGTVTKADRNLEDYGFLFEKVILFATDIGLGTCWLGGTFTKSGFSKKIDMPDGYSMPAIAAVGNIYDTRPEKRAFMSRHLKPVPRKDWNELFFDRQFGSPLVLSDKDKYSLPLEMVRLAPSASNKQPWRIIKDGDKFHFYMQRTKGYRESLPFKILKIDDMQRIDMGIAMCHFELAASESGLKGRWIVNEPDVIVPDSLTAYTASWQIM